MSLTATPHHRRIARDLARAGALLSAAMLVAGLVGNRDSADAAATDAGAVVVVAGPGNPNVGAPITSGGSATRFALQLPAAAACSGDSATGGYRVQTFIVPASVSLAGLTFDANGPVPFGTGASLRLPLYAQGTPYVDGNTAINTGAIVGLPAFDFGVFGADGPTIVPAGDYHVGVACTKGAASATQLDKYWSVRLTFQASASDQPSGITWRLASVPTATTTTAAATTTAAGATTTTLAGGGTTTTVAGATTTSSTVAGATTTTLSGSSSVTTVYSSGYGGGQLAATGSSPLPTILWGVLLLVLGRMAILLGRPIRVRPSDQA